MISPFGESTLDLVLAFLLIILGLLLMFDLVWMAFQDQQEEEEVEKIKRAIDRIEREERKR